MVQPTDADPYKAGDKGGDSVRVFFRTESTLTLARFIVTE